MLDAGEQPCVITQGRRGVKLSSHMGCKLHPWCNHAAISYQQFPYGSTFPIHNPELRTSNPSADFVQRYLSCYLVYWRVDAEVFAPRGVGQAEAGCHGVLSEVDEPMAVGEVARDVLRLAEM